MREPALLDAQYIARLHNRTHSVPAKSELEALAPGDMVKVGTADEHFWLDLTAVNGNVLEGCVNTRLLSTPLHVGEAIRCRKAHVFKVMLRQ